MKPVPVGTVPEVLKLFSVNADELTAASPVPRYIWLSALYAVIESWICTRSVRGKLLRAVASSSQYVEPRKRLRAEPG